MSENKIAIAVYSRKSRFTGKGESIGNQVELCREYIRTHYGEQAMERMAIYEDEGFSGGNLNRPGFKEMMKAARNGSFGMLIVYRLDRISRNISDFSGLIEELSRLGIAFVSIREQFDTGTPMGRAMMYIASVFSQLERETIAERIRDNMHELAKTGRWLGGTTPIGYASESVRNVTVDGKTKKTCRLRLIPEEAEVVRTIYRLFGETHSLTLTEAELIRRRLVTRSGKYFTRFSVKAILQNPVYLIADADAKGYFADQGADLFSEDSGFDGEHGILAYNRTRQEKGRTTVYLPVQDWIVSVGQHPGLIPGSTWIGVQKMLEQNRSKSFRRPRGNEALLTGLLYCRCGSRMYPKLTGRRAEDGSPAFSYVCKIKERSQRSVCREKNINGNRMDQAVWKQLKELKEDREHFIHQLEKSRKWYVSSRTSCEQQLLSIRQEEAQLERKIAALVDSLAELGAGSARLHVAKRIEQLHQELETVQGRIRELEESASAGMLGEKELISLGQRLSEFSSSTDEMDVEQKREMLRALVDKVIWDGQTAYMAFSGASMG